MLYPSELGRPRQLRHRTPVANQHWLHDCFVRRSLAILTGTLRLVPDSDLASDYQKTSETGDRVWTVQYGQMGLVCELICAGVWYLHRHLPALSRAT